MFYYGFGFPWFIFGWGVFWIIIFVCCFALFGSRRHYHWRGDYWQHWNDNKYEGSQDPLDIVKQRYAKGEINKEEFDRIKKDLQDGH